MAHMPLVSFATKPNPSTYSKNSFLYRPKIFGRNLLLFSELILNLHLVKNMLFQDSITALVSNVSENKKARFCTLKHVNG
jgi:hypothetical protein